MTAAITVAVCDASEIARAGIGLALRHHHIRVVGQAADHRSAVALASKGSAQVALIDVALWPAPLAAAEVIAAAVTAGSIAVAMGVDAEPDQMLTALRAGAAGFVTKDMPAAAWADSVSAAARGEAPLSRALTARLVEAFRAQSGNLQLIEILPSERRLSRREWKVLVLVSKGMTNRQVAEELRISVETVRTHVSSILAKLQAPNRSAAAALYAQIRSIQA